jgi:hypothetical protein
MHAERNPELEIPALTVLPTEGEEVRRLVPLDSPSDGAVLRPGERATARAIVRRVFTPEERAAVRERVFALAREDARISGGAVTGSGSIGAEDEWSDVDTSFGVMDGVDPLEVLDDWTRALQSELELVHHWDLYHGSTIYRVYLLPSSLELDIAVTPAAEFAQHGPRFKLVFGESGEAQEPDPPALDETIGLGWLAALDARLAIERAKPWQAVFFVNLLRDQALGLACIRHGLPPEYARGTDRLPREVTERYEQTLARSLDLPGLRRALAAATTAFIREVGEADAELAERLSLALSEVAAPR